MFCKPEQYIMILMVPKAAAFIKSDTMSFKIVNEIHMGLNDIRENVISNWQCYFALNINDLVKNCSNSIAKALELLQYYT